MLCYITSGRRLSAAPRRAEAIKGRVETVAARIASVKERMRALHAEAFAMRRANLVRIAAEPMDELPENRGDAYRSATTATSDDDAKRIDEPNHALPSLPSSA